MSKSLLSQNHIELPPPRDNLLSWQLYVQIFMLLYRQAHQKSQKQEECIKYFDPCKDTRLRMVWCVF